MPNLLKVGEPVILLHTLNYQRMFGMHETYLIIDSIHTRMLKLSILDGSFAETIPLIDDITQEGLFVSLSADV